MNTRLEAFEKTKEAVYEALKPYAPELIHTDPELEDAKLYKADKALNDTLVNLKVELENSYDDFEVDGKKYNFAKIVKFYNPNTPVSSYSVQIETKWKQVNDPEKVKANLEKEFEIWKNATHMKAIAKLADMMNETDKSQEEKEYFKGEIKEHEEEINKAKRICDELVTNFDEYSEVRICSKHRAHNFGTIHYVLDKDTRKKAHLSSRLPNVIYFEEKETRPYNKLADFLKKAQKAYGDVYYIK